MTEIRHEPTAFDLIAASAAAAETRRRRDRVRNIGIGIAGFLALLSSWKLVVLWLNVPPYILPAPGARVHRAVERHRGLAGKPARLLPAAVEHAVQRAAGLPDRRRPSASCSAR